MKLLVAAAVAAFAFPAFAQDTPAAAPPPQTTPMPADPAAPAPMPADPAAPAPMPADPAMAPAPMAPPAPMAAAPAPAPQASYPMCSKTVTDSCMERSNGRGERLHSTPRKPG